MKRKGGGCTDHMTCTHSSILDYLLQHAAMASIRSLSKQKLSHYMCCLCSIKATVDKVQEMALHVHPVLRSYYV